MSRLLLLLLCLFGSSWVGKAQEIYTIPIQYPQQLPTRTIYDMLVGRQGYIFVGTDKGLFRFNGKDARLIPYQKSRQADITYLKEDKKGRIWGMNFAKQIFYLEDDTLRLFSFDNQDITGALLNFEFTENTIWVATHTRLLAYRWTDFKLLWKKDFEMHFYSIASYQNKLWISTQGKVLHFTEAGTHTEENTALTKEAHFASAGEDLYCIQTKQNNRLYAHWRNTQKSLYKLDLPPRIHIYHMNKTNEKWWICTKQGAYLFYPALGNTVCLFPDQDVTDIAEDYQGNIWISTLNKGLWFCPSMQTLFFPSPAKSEIQTVYAYQDAMYLSLSDEHLWKIGQDNIWTDLAKVSEGQFRKIIFDAENKRIVAGNGVFDLQGRQRHKLMLVKDAVFYQEGADEWLLIAQTFGAVWIQMNAPLPAQAENTTFKGFRFNLPTSRVLQKKVYQDRTQRAYCVAIDTLRQKFWVGYEDGLWEYTFAGKKKELLTDKGEHITAKDLVLHPDGTLYAGTYQQGFWAFKNQKVTLQLSVGKGLKSNQIRKLLWQNNQLWIGTEAEILYQLNGKLQDVLAINGLGSGFAYKDFCVMQNFVYIALPHGLLRLAFNENAQTHFPRLLPIRKTQREFHMEALHYKNPSQVAIYYRLAGKEQTWHKVVQLQTEVNYAYLNGGHYTIEAYAQDLITGAKSTIQRLDFEVPTAWWQTWWFWGLVFLGVNGGILGLAYLYFQRERKQQYFKEQLWISQLKALRAQMNPHFLYNILNTVQGLVYGNRKKEAGQLLGNFSHLMRKSLQASENAYISLREELEILNLYLMLEKARFDDTFQYTLKQANINEYLHLKIPSMLIQPFVENALKHGLLHKQGEKYLEISFEIQTHPNALKVTIDDNGIGRQASAEINQRHPQKSAGFATRATAQRIELLNLDKKNHITWHIHDKPQGTKVELIIHVPIP